MELSIPATVTLGEPISHGFTTGTSRVWPTACCRQSHFPLDSASRDATGSVTHTLTQHYYHNTYDDHSDSTCVVSLSQNTDINLVAAVYNARGDFLQWEKVGGNNLQVKQEVHLEPD